MATGSLSLPTDALHHHHHRCHYHQHTTTIIFIRRDSLFPLPYLLPILLHPALYPRQLTHLDFIHRLPCPLPSSWEWPMGCCMGQGSQSVYCSGFLPSGPQVENGCTPLLRPPFLSADALPLLWLSLLPGPFHLWGGDGDRSLLLLVTGASSFLGVFS